MPDVAVSSATGSVAAVPVAPVSMTVVSGVDGGVSVVGPGGSNVVGVSGKKVVGGSGPGPVLTVEDGSLVDVVVVEDGSAVVEEVVVGGALVGGSVVVGVAGGAVG